MGDRTGIEWTEATWNPTLGCSRVSPGCDNCYAIGQAHRNTAMGSPAYVPPLTVRTEHGTDWTGELRTMPDRLDQPLRWKRPRLIFVNSMSDLFHPDVPLHFAADVWRTMSASPQHTFQVLTKRPQRMASEVGWEIERAQMYGTGNAFVVGDPDTGYRPLPNVWLGTSIESDRYAFRADHLRATPAAVRFVSAEPVLGPLPSLDLAGIDWLIVGAESGAGARPMDEAWVRDLRDRAADAGTALFVKQLYGGRFAVKDPDQFPADLRVRQFPKTP